MTKSSYSTALQPTGNHTLVEGEPQNVEIDVLLIAEFDVTFALPSCPTKVTDSQSSMSPLVIIEDPDDLVFRSSPTYDVRAMMQRCHSTIGLSIPAVPRNPMTLFAVANLSHSHTSAMRGENECTS